MEVIKIYKGQYEGLTMRFYNVEMKGKFKLDPLSSLPAYNPDDEGRLMYYNNSLYFTDSTAQVTVAGGGSGGGDASLLNGQPGSYYLCANNMTGTIDATTFVGVIPTSNGGTGATTASGSRTNLGLTGNSNTTHYHDGRYYTETEGDARYGRLGETNTWTGFNNIFSCNVRMYDSLRLISDDPYIMCVCNCTNANAHGIHVEVENGAALCLQNCSASESALHAQNWCGDPTICAYGYCGIALNARTAYCTHAIVGCATGPAGTVAVYGLTASGYSVAGNTAYANLSSKYLKHLQPVCLSNCIRETPLKVYRYYWEDSNYKGLNETIGPTAEDFNNTFNVDHQTDGEDYQNLWSVDGAALGLGIENLKEMDKIKDIMVQMYSCIQKLETEVESLKQ